MKRVQPHSGLHPFTFLTAIMRLRPYGVTRTMPHRP